MSVHVTATNNLLTSGRDSEQARTVLTRLVGPEGQLAVERGDDTIPVPRETGMLLQQVLEAVASGRAVTVAPLPHELTTSAAAALLGVSRPTLMKMIRDGEVAAHKVRSHTRLATSDVLEARKRRRDRERAAFEDLLALEDDEI